MATQVAPIRTYKMDDRPPQPNSIHSFTSIMEVILIVISLLVLGLVVIFEVQMWVNLHNIESYEHRILYFQYLVESCVFFMGIGINSENQTHQLKRLWL